MFKAKQRTDTFFYLASVRSLLNLSIEK